MNVTVTGASGFVGQNLARFFLKEDINFFPLSVRDRKWEEMMPMVGSALIHLAGKAHDTSNTTDQRVYFEVNRDLTIRIFDRFLASEIRDFFFISSVKAVADTLVSPLTEEIAGSPLTPYGKSKREAEEYLLNQQLPEGKRLFIIRPCMIHGPYNKGNLNLLYNVVRKGIPWPLADFQNERSFLSVDNLCFLLGRMMRDETLSSGVYNFADDSPISTNALVGLIGNCIGKSTKLWHFPKTIVKSIASIGDAIPFPLNSERLKKLTESYVVSNAKIKRELNLDKLPLTVEDGLKKTILSFVKPS
ncbi:NAD-dependent epimerase/dehydratase family protein [Sphingobacterium griseoflavum]|uniref:Nucleoside-diphosphate-sugar epimerase n=1 Tax=Sphingobacterium griseoflavum TaxID=1474952 RepID=A0ABQ3HXX9_9SPHI|nr:NAD-dependent epimerase/dehydratase family protein [Sphingobacterium griseoflavum]GHE38953.1 nucleoside-diphosphate-sugar epimerase [Sphingobacterium griseoflavum]